MIPMYNSIRRWLMACKKEQKFTPNMICVSYMHGLDADLIRFICLTKNGNDSMMAEHKWCGTKFYPEEFRTVVFQGESDIQVIQTVADTYPMAVYLRSPEMVAMMEIE